MDYKDYVKPMSRLQLERWKKKIIKHGVEVYKHGNDYSGVDKLGNQYPLTTDVKSAINFGGKLNSYLTIKSGNQMFYMPYLNGQRRQRNE